MLVTNVAGVSLGGECSLRNSAINLIRFALCSLVHGFSSVTASVTGAAVASSAGASVTAAAAVAFRYELIILCSS